ncbi:MAG TPA: hypothetical protein VF120_18005, partial [Ktedonobacterales bacterium]
MSTISAPMPLDVLLSEIAARGVRLFVDGGRLAYEAPENALTEEMLAAIRVHKAHLPVVLSLDDLWGELERLGVTIIRSADGQLSARPASAVTPAMLSALREHKAWIGEYMAASALDAFPPRYADVDAAVISEEVAARIARHPFVYRPELEPMPDMVPLPEPEPEPVIWRYSWNPGAPWMPTPHEACPSCGAHMWGNAGGVVTCMRCKQPWPGLVSRAPLSAAAVAVEPTPEEPTQEEPRTDTRTSSSSVSKTPKGTAMHNIAALDANGITTEEGQHFTLAPDVPLSLLLARARDRKITELWVHPSFPLTPAHLAESSAAGWNLPGELKPWTSTWQPGTYGRVDLVVTAQGDKFSEGEGWAEAGDGPALVRSVVAYRDAVGINYSYSPGLTAMRLLKTLHEGKNTLDLAASMAPSDVPPPAHQ